jgi:hypothetical protein
MKALLTILLFLTLTSISFAQSGRFKLKTGWYQISAKPNAYPRKLEGTGDFYFLEGGPSILLSEITELNIYKNSYGIYCLKMKLDSAGQLSWNKLLQVEKDNKLAFVVKNRLLYCPYVNGQIVEGLIEINRGDFNIKKLKKIKKTILDEKKEDERKLKEMMKKAMKEGKAK